MKKRTRRILFWIAALSFVIITWVVIRYAQGYAYDFSAHMFVRTGAIAITANTDATFFVDEVAVGTTSFLGNHVGRDGLLPGEYAIRVARENYTTWRKNVTVEEGRLTDFPHVLLLPTDDASLLGLKREASESLRESKTLTPLGLGDGHYVLQGTNLLDTRTASASLVAEQVLGFSLSKDEGRILWWTRNELWVLWLKNTDQQPYRAEGERQAITRFSVPILRAAWFRDLEYLVVDLGNQSYRIVETDARGGTNIIKL